MNSMIYDEATIGLTGFYVGYMVTLYSLLIAFSVVAYILQGKAFSAIARRRGIEKPWLAWVPIGNMWLLGCISDQYRYLTYNQQCNKRGKLLWTEIGVLAAGVLVCVFAVIALVADQRSSNGIAWDVSVLTLLVSLAMLAVAIVYCVVYYKACYDLFRSCDPDKSLLFLLVSIFASYPLPFFIYSCRNKDLGMPPRQPQPLED